MDVTDPSSSKVLAYLTETEALAQDIFTEKELKLELSNAANKYNEAIRALEKTDERKTWLKVSNIYIELPVGECRDILKDEKEKTQVNINKLYDSIKEKVGKLRDMEHQSDFKGFDLKPISKEEANFVHKAMGFNLK